MCRCASGIDVHRVHGVHDEIQHHLLQLHGIAQNSGRFAARSVSTVTRRLISSLRSSAVVELTVSLMSTSSDRLSPFLSSPRNLLNDFAGAIVLFHNIIKRTLTSTRSGASHSSR